MLLECTTDPHTIDHEIDAEAVVESLAGLALNWFRVKPSRVGLIDRDPGKLGLVELGFFAVGSSQVDKWKTVEESRMPHEDNYCPIPS